MPSTRWRFGEIEVSPLERRLRVRGEAVALGGRAFDVLLALIHHRHRVVAKAELLDAVWPGKPVEESNLQVQVAALRKALGRDAITTVHGVGYQFTAPPYEAEADASVLDIFARRHPRPAAVTRTECAMNLVAGLAIEAERAYWVTPDREWIARFDGDYAQLQLGFDQACDRNDPGTAAAAAEALRWLDLERSSPAGTRRRMQPIRQLLAVAAPLPRARLLNCLTTFRQLNGPGADSSCTWAEERAMAWKSLGDKMHAHLALCRLAAYRAARGEPDRAEAAMREALRLGGDSPPRGRLYQMENQAFLSCMREDGIGLAEQASRLLDESRRFGAPRMETIARLFLSRAALLGGDVDGSLDLLEQPIRDSLRAGHRQLAGKGLCDLTFALLEACDLEAARRAASEAMPLAQRSQLLHILLDHVALIAALGGGYGEAARISGLADAHLARSGEVRRWLEAKSSRRAARAIEERLGRSEHLRLRRAGSRLAGSAAAPLIDAVLA